MYQEILTLNFSLKNFLFLYKSPLAGGGGTDPVLQDAQ